MTAIAAVPADLAQSAGRPDSDLRRMLNWLACWVALPNLPFLPITLMGGPPRFPEVLVCAIVGLVVRRMNYWIRLSSFFLTMGYLVATFISRMFNMSVAMLVRVSGFIVEMQPGVSLEYVAGGLLLVLTLAMAAWLLRQRSDFRDTAMLVGAIAATSSLAGCDYLLSKDALGSYNRIAPADAPFTSATTQAGLLKLANGKRNIVIVIVEAMGQPIEPGLRQQFDRIWVRPELASRFDISQGQTEFFGSTTSGEMRELCQRWANYEEIAGPQPNCLPAILAKRGYATTSYHAFTSNFFDRGRWYPLIGFQHSLFEKDLLASGASFCPNVFAGACDRDVPKFISRQLAQGGKPQFVYWLTLNSHLPIAENRELGTANCHKLGHGRDKDYPMICRLFSLWQDTADSLVKVVTGPDFPPTDILIVGDHMPPFTHQKSRLQFDPAHVPWVLLRYREPQAGPAAQPRP